MDCAMQSLRCRARIDIAKQLGRGTALVASQTDADDAVAGLAQRDGLVEHQPGAARAEVADGVEDPVQRHAEIALTALPSRFQSFEKRGEFTPSPVDDSDRYVHLRVQHVLRV